MRPGLGRDVRDAIRVLRRRGSGEGRQKQGGDKVKERGEAGHEYDPFETHLHYTYALIDVQGEMIKPIGPDGRIQDLAVRIG